MLFGRKIALVLGTESVGDATNPGRVIDLMRMHNDVPLCADRPNQRDVQVQAQRQLEKAQASVEKAQHQLDRLHAR
jgi:hypothetical protein